MKLQEKLELIEIYKKQWPSLSTLEEANGLLETKNRIKINRILYKKEYDICRNFKGILNLIGDFMKEEENEEKEN